MTCDDFQQQWLAARYAAAHDALTTGHMASCPVCRAFVHEATALDAVLAVDTPQSPSYGFDTRFFARLKAQQQARVAWYRRWQGRWGLALASILCIAVSVGLLINRRSGPNIPPQDLAVAMNDIDMLQEDVHMLSMLSDVEAYQILSDLPPGALDEGQKP